VAKHIPSERVTKQIGTAFVAHGLTEEQQTRAAEMRDRFRTLAYSVADNMQEGREQSVVLTKLEEAMFFCSAGIAREGAK
jgi:hypothetical protein